MTQIAVIKGDGIGRDCIDATLPILEKALAAVGLAMPRLDEINAGAGYFREPVMTSNWMARHVPKMLMPSCWGRLVCPAYALMTGQRSHRICACVTGSVSMLVSDLCGHGQVARKFLPQMKPAALILSSSARALKDCSILRLCITEVMLLIMFWLKKHSE